MLPKEKITFNPKVGGELMFVVFSMGYQFNYFKNGNEKAFANALTIGIWLANRFKFTYADHLFFNDENPFPYIGRRTITLIYGLDFKKV